MLLILLALHRARTGSFVAAAGTTAQGSAALRFATAPRGTGSTFWGSAFPGHLKFWVFTFLLFGIRALTPKDSQRTAIFFKIWILGMRIIRSVAFLVIGLIVFDSSAYAEKVCPVDGEVWPDSTQYCGKHGAKLVPRKPAAKKATSLTASDEIARAKAKAAAKEIARDGRFIAYRDGTVLDTQTNLMWAARDNGSKINWVNAKSYCENYRGGGYTDWRMPTQDELAGLYDAAKTDKSDCGWYDVHLTELIRLTCTAPWASETRGSDAASFSFFIGLRTWFPQSGDFVTRALPVRSGK
jgi:hypothetical protein